MAKKITTIEGLAEMIQRTMASKEDIKQLRTEMATKSELKELKDVVRDTAEELTTMHGDVSYIRSTMNALTHSDIAQETTIIDLKARVHRVEQKVGLVK